MTVPQTDIGFADKEVENLADWETTLANEKRIQKNVRGFRKENPIFNSILLIFVTDLKILFLYYCVIN